VPFAALNVGIIAGGSAANVIPDRCVIHLGVRLLPEMSPDEMAERIRATVRPAVGGDPFTLDHVSMSPAMMLPAEAEIHRKLCDAVGQHESHSVMFATDAGWLQRIGLDCVLFGPGTIEVAHRANESLPVAEFIRGGRLLGDLIQRTCLAA